MSALVGRVVSLGGMTFDEAWEMTMHEYVSLLDALSEAGKASLKRTLPGREDMEDFINNARRKGVRV